MSAALQREPARLQHPWLDPTDAPLLRLTCPVTYEPHETLAMFEVVLAFYAVNDQPFAWVVDASNVKGSSAQERKITADYEQRAAEHLKRFNRGTAFVLPSAIVRGIVTAIYWLVPPPYPHRVFSNVPDAEAWARAQLGGVGG